jgi:AraC-like DNA-binding protein
VTLVIAGLADERGAASAWTAGAALSSSGDEMSRGDPLFIFRLCPVVLGLIGKGAREQKALLARCGLPESAAVGTITAPLSRIRQLLDEAALRSEQPEPFGLALALAAPEGTYDTAELLVRTAPSLRLGLSALARYAALINPVGRFEVRPTKKGLELHYFVPGARDVLGIHLNEFTIAFMVQAITKVIRSPLTLGRAFFAHRDARHRDALAEHFGCDVAFGAATCGFAIDQPTADAPLRTADPVVFDYLERQAEARLSALGQRSYAAVVIDAIENRVGFAGADLERVARALGATGRTVQRRLDKEGTTFREVFEDARKRRSEAMLGTGASNAQIAEALGFADTRSFRRAFRRWAM